MIEIENSYDFEGLRKCDLFVYGLIVWSAFCLRGSNPPPNPKLEDARADLQRLGTDGGIFSFTRARLANRILKVLEKTMKEHGSRNDPAPWKYLKNGRNRTHKSRDLSTTESAVGIFWAFCVVNNWLRTTLLFLKSMYSHLWRAGEPKFIERIQDPFKKRSMLKNGAPVGLSSSVKAKYNRKNWWQQHIMTDSTTGAGFLASVINSFLDTEPHPTQTQASEDEIYGPASSTVLSSDENSLGIALFEGTRRRGDARRHSARMLENIQNISKGRPQGSLPELYYDARFRSRIRHEWWAQYPPQNNILGEALQISPPIDIDTLAWLCNGEVGKYEVQNLPASDVIWRSIISRPISSRTKFTTLNESEKLDRFLLLLQFGARVEKELIVESTRQYSSKDTPDTIFSAFISSCRPATISVVLREVNRRFEEVKLKDHIAESTKAYMTGNSSTTLSDSSQAKADISKEGIREVLHEDRYLGGTSNRTPRPSKSDQSWFGRILQGILLSIGKILHRTRFQGTTRGHNGRHSTLEHTPLLKVPQGWKAAPNQSYFEEEFSQSFTLTRPEVSLIGKRQIEVGFLNKGPANVCHVDLTSCMPPSTDVINIEALESRFPFYDDDWFSMEWMTETTRKDVLGDIRDPWPLRTPLRTFAIRVTVPAYLTSILDWIKAIAAWTALIVTFGGIAIGLIVAFWQAAKRLEEHYKDVVH